MKLLNFKFESGNPNKKEIALILSVLCIWGELNLKDEIILKEKNSLFLKKLRYRFIPKLFKK